MAKTPEQFNSDLDTLTDAEVRADFFSLFNEALSIEEAEQLLLLSEISSEPDDTVA